MAYYVAASLVALRTEINRRWPNRDKASDGAIGDTAHSARKSDHNPDYSAGGVVRAIDVDKDGINVTELLAAVVRDPRVAYVIWNRRIASATDDGKPWDWEPYDGDNPHDKHIHISIKHTRAAETNTSRWFKAPAKPAGTTPTEPVQEDVMTEAQMQELKNFIEARTKAYAIACNNYTRQVLATATGVILAAGGNATAAVAELNAELDVRDAAMQADLDEINAKVTPPVEPPKA